MPKITDRIETHTRRTVTYSEQEIFDIIREMTNMPNGKFIVITRGGGRYLKEISITDYLVL